MSKKRGRITGHVPYSLGDGVEQVIPIGPCDIDSTSQDATLSWVEGETTGLAALPVDVYTVYLTDGRIVVEADR